MLGGPRVLGVGRLGLAGGLVAAIAGVTFATGYTSTRALAKDDSAWLRKGVTIAHINGPSARYDAVVADGTNAVASSPSDPLDVVQEPNGQVYTADPVTHRVFRVDLNTMAPQPGPAGTAVLASGSSVYVVDGAARTVTAVNPQTLAPGRSISLPAPVASSSIASDGTVYVGETNGAVSSVRDGQVHTVDLGRPGEAMTVTVVGGQPAAVDAAAGMVYAVGQSQPPMPLPGSPGSAVEVAANQPAGPLWLVRAGRLVGLDLSSGRSRTAVLAGSDAYEAPVANGGRVYVPDRSASAVAVFDASALAPVDTIPVPRGTPGQDQIEVVVNDGRVWIDNPTSRDGKVVNPDGSVQTIDKGSGDQVTDPNAPSTSAPAPAPEPLSTPVTVPVPTPVPVPSVAAAAAPAPLSTPAASPVTRGRPYSTAPPAPTVTPPASLNVPVSPDGGGSLPVPAANVPPQSPAPPDGGTAPPATTTPPASTGTTTTTTSPPLSPSPPRPSPPPTVRIPSDLVGQTAEAAQAELRTLGLNGVVTYVAHAAPSGKPDIVAAVSPSGGSVNPGSQVVLDVDELAVPAVPAGASFQTYCATVDAEGFSCNPANLGQGPAGSIPGAVVHVSPSPGTLERPQTPIGVGYYSSAGAPPPGAPPPPPPPPTAPSCVGLTVAQCQARMPAGLVLVPTAQAHPSVGCDLIFSSSQTGTTVSVSYNSYCAKPFGEWHDTSSAAPNIWYLGFSPPTAPGSWAEQSVVGYAYPLSAGTCPKAGTTAVYEYEYPPAGTVHSYHYYFTATPAAPTGGWRLVGAIACVYSPTAARPANAVAVYAHLTNPGAIPQDWSWELVAGTGTPLVWYQPVAGQ